MTATVEAPAALCPMSPASTPDRPAPLPVACDGPDAHAVGGSVWHSHTTAPGSFRTVWTDDGRVRLLVDADQWQAPTTEEETVAEALAARRDAVRVEAEFHYRVQQANRRTSRAVLRGRDVYSDGDVVAHLESGDLR